MQIKQVCSNDGDKDHNKIVRWFQIAAWLEMLIPWGEEDEPRHPLS